MNSDSVISQKYEERNFLWSLIKWNFHSRRALDEHEEKILSGIKSNYKTFYVDIGHCIGPQNDKIWTLSINTESPNFPLVLIHGFGGGIGFWVLNYDELAADRPVYAIDVPGYGKSTRSEFSNDPIEIKTQYCNALEKWLQLMKIGRFILLGHSFGAYISLFYAMKFPDNIEHLILADPWGIMGIPRDIKDYSLLKRSQLYFTCTFSPLLAVRIIGPIIGPFLIEKFRVNIVEKYKNVVENHVKTMANYLYHCNSQETTGELAFKNLLHVGTWPKSPLSDKLDLLCDKIPLTVMYGEKSWINRSYLKRLNEIRPESSYTHFECIESAGHLLYSDNASEFNRIVNEACKILKHT